MVLGFSVFASIVIAEQFGSPLIKSASVTIGLFTGCLISVVTGYWSLENIRAAPAATVSGVHTFHLPGDGASVPPLLIMFVCEAVSCMPDILATAETSNVDIEGTEFNSRIRGGILCDGIGFLHIMQPDWFGKILDYTGPRVHLSGFEQGVNLIVERPFIPAAVIRVFLRLPCRTT